MNPTNRLTIQWSKGEFTLAQLVKLNPSCCELTLRVVISKLVEAGKLRVMTPIVPKNGRPKSVFSFTGA